MRRGPRAARIGGVMVDISPVMLMAGHAAPRALQGPFASKGTECDRRTAWELRVSSWSGTPVHFDLVLDNIAVEEPGTRN